MKVGIVAGEPSGDLFAAHLIRSVRAVLPEAEFVGVAGPKMQAEGARTLYPMERLSVRGYVEVLRHLRGLLAMRRELAEYFVRERPRLFIGVDAPDFNLGLERTLGRAGIATVQYIVPAVWAWRPERIEQLRASAGHILSIFPFEAELLRNSGVPVTYVGHPAADLLPDPSTQSAARAALGIVRAEPLIALLPGSRESELAYHAELFAATARLVAAALPGARFVAALANERTFAQFRDACDAAAGGVPIQLELGRAHEALAAADIALVASGTASLETALMTRPMVITYRLSELSYRIIKRKHRLPWIGLPNIVCNESVVPELVQHDANPADLARALVALWHDPLLRARIVRRFERLRQELRCDSGARLAAAVLPMIAPELAGAAA